MIHRSVGGPRSINAERNAVPDLRATLLASWRTNNRITILLIQQVPLKLWRAPVPGAPRRTVCSIAAHLHNARRSWIRTLGSEHGVTVPEGVDHRRVSRRDLAAALRKSGRCIAALLALGITAGGQVPPSRRYVWRNLPLDVGHVLAYFVAHEAHHRGQIVMLARQLGHPLSRLEMGRLWWWRA